ncbi:GGDEF domain-containing protein [Sulfurimonas paralvinellae]|uniref:GGDEF domain-containing protein n=1 Tax=Sulfurimonas paralvinellae TaxID=317658 RepID=A0A7M1BA88_9BACT|nr:GGDEF domain-containing protein [Sulfurimonas paralvinellae]QOP46541.1 GGDEF domain-containing protein [Sulfurimonas paralvinellae]
MKNDSIAQRYLENEKVQIFLRLFFIAIFMAVFYYDYYYAHNVDYRGYSAEEIMAAPVFVVFLNLFYFLTLKYFPYVMQKERILFSIIIDVALSVYVMYLIGSLSAYFAGILLWYIVGYGMRYGKLMAYTAYVAVLISWMVLITTSTYWLDERAMAIGWLITYLVIPLYYFKMVSQMHEYITILYENVEESAHKARHDELTALGNRYLFDADLNEYISRFHHDAKPFALFFVDLDSFKKINDEYGHDIGDKVLVEASRRLESIILDTYRLGGDEFVCMTHYENANELENIAKNLMFNLTMPCKDSNIVLSASIGIARFPDDATSDFDIKKRADLAMYAAKQAGKNRFYFYGEVA